MKKLLERNKTFNTNCLRRRTTARLAQTDLPIYKPNFLRKNPAKKGTPVEFLDTSKFMQHNIEFYVWHYKLKFREHTHLCK